MYLFGQIDPYFEICDILRQKLEETHDKLKMRKLTYLPRFATSTVTPKSYGDKTQMFLRS